MNAPKNNKEFFMGLLGALAVHVVLILIFIFVMNLYDKYKPTKQTPTTKELSPAQQEYNDVMESKNYSPDSEGGEMCNSPVCD